MKYIIAIALCLFSFASPALAHEGAIESPHLVINFAGVNELDWAASEETWQKEVKPQVERQILQMHESFDHAHDERHPTLTWSTLMEYMNFPLDAPSQNSVYAVKMRRILEIAEELDIPVFVPLNGFQWWDQLPELYNWWDPDGTQTDPKFFARQKNPEEFKARFIAGYDPDNTENVEWQSSRTPMKLGYRNWGGGGFRLAPPPNLLSQKFQSVQQARLKVILAEIVKKQNEWNAKGKGNLFVGVSIGTEISLNASITPADEFKPYGYGSIATLKERYPEISAKAQTTDQLRTEVLRTYLEQTAQYVHRSGIAKDKIFTHVYGETDSSDSHYAPYAESAFNLYSNPGSSFYGHKDDPLASMQWKNMLQKYGNPTWGAIEYSDTPSESGLVRTLSSASLVDIYNWDGIQTNFPTLHAIKVALTTPIEKDDCDEGDEIVHVQSGLTARLGNPEIHVSTTSALPHGIYSWFTETKCGTDRVSYSTPQVLYVPLTTKVDMTPGWVKWILQVLEKSK